MRITVEIDDNQLAAIQEATGLTKKSPAIRRAIEDHLAGLARKRFLQRILNGGSDYSLSNEELEALGLYDTH